MRGVERYSRKNGGKHQLDVHVLKKNTFAADRVTQLDKGHPIQGDKAMIKLPLHRAFLASLLAASLFTPAMAAPGASLGQAWPNTQDVSASPHWHVYLFTAGGIRYVQINDLNGNIRGAVATANGQFLVLPMGRDAQHFATPQHPLASGDTVVPLASYAETVYRDQSVRIDAVPLSDGSTSFTAAPLTTVNTAVGPCDDPVECGGHAP
jgi:hypothetical protein